MLTTVSRGIESVELLPPPTRISTIESERLGWPILFAPGSLESFVRASEPSTRIVFGDVSGYPPPPSSLSAPEETLADWICAETRNSTSEISTHATSAVTSQRSTRQGEIRGRRRGFFGVSS